MKIERMVHGEIIETTELAPETLRIKIGRKSYDRQTTVAIRAFVVKHEERGDFIESGIDDDKDGNEYWWFIVNCGDNCTRFYPDGWVGTTVTGNY
jgi:hypothetical protein